MRKLHPSTKYKKDLKKFARDAGKMQELMTILAKLQNEEPIPLQYRPHQLTGDYSGCTECHIQNDFLLIWIDDDVVELVRLGSHSDLFGKKRR